MKNFGKFSTKRLFFKKVFFANISRTVRARAKILVETNPLGHKHTPPHLFPAKNVILSKFCHGFEIGSFFNEKRFKKGWFLPKKLIKYIMFWHGRHFKQIMSNICLILAANLCSPLTCISDWFFIQAAQKISKFAEFAASCDKKWKMGISRCCTGEFFWAASMKNQSEMEDYVEQGFATKMRLLFDKTDTFWENFEKFQEKNYKN